MDLLYSVSSLPPSTQHSKLAKISNFNNDVIKFQNLKIQNTHIKMTNEKPNKIMIFHQANARLYNPNLVKFTSRKPKKITRNIKKEGNFSEIRNSYISRTEGRGGVWAASRCDGGITTTWGSGGGWGGRWAADVEGGWATDMESGWEAPLAEVKSSCLASFFAGKSAVVVDFGGELPPFSLSSIVSDQSIFGRRNSEETR